MWKKPVAESSGGPDSPVWNVNQKIGSGLMTRETKGATKRRDTAVRAEETKEYGPKCLLWGKSLGHQVSADLLTQRADNSLF